MLLQCVLRIFNGIQAFTSCRLIIILNELQGFTCHNLIIILNGIQGFTSCRLIIILNELRGFTCNKLIIILNGIQGFTSCRLIIILNELQDFTSYRPIIITVRLFSLLRISVAFWQICLSGVSKKRSTWSGPILKACSHKFSAFVLCPVVSKIFHISR
jgi:hypothetical protein